MSAPKKPNPDYVVNLKKWTNLDELDKVLDSDSLSRLKERFPDKVDEIFKISKENLVKLKQ